MIIRDKKILFVHIPKTGGQSISKFFYENLGHVWDQKNKNKKEFLFLQNYDRKLPGPEVLVHMTASEYIDLGYISQLEFEDFFKFTIVRNPYTRFISAFKFNKLYEKYHIEDFIDYIPSDNMTDLYRHFAPQTSYILSGNTYMIDKIIYFENLDDEFNNYIIQPFGLRGTLSKINKTKYKQKSKITITKKVKDFIDEYYQKDFSELGYKHSETGRLFKL